MKTNVHSFARLALLLSLSLPLVPHAQAGSFNAGADTFANAPNISDDQDYSGADVSLSTNIIAFTTQAGEPSHRPYGDVGAGKTIWWSWRAPETGYCTVGTQRSLEATDHLLDTVISVYTGASVGSLTRVSANDDAPGLTVNVDASQLSSTTFHATKDTLYHIAVDGYQPDSVGAGKNHVILDLHFLPLIKTGRAAYVIFGGSPGEQGMLTCNTTTKGTLTGKLTVGLKTYSFAGTIGLNGVFQAAIPQKSTGNIPKPPLTLALDLTGDGRGFVSNGQQHWAGDFPPRLIFTPQQPNPTAGIYTAFIDHNYDPLVGGEGIFTLTNKTTGLVTGVGNAPDGTPITFSSAIYKRTVDDHAHIPAFRSLHGGKAVFVLRGALHEDGTPDLLEGGLGYYLRLPDVPPAGYYPNGINCSFAFTGSTYLKPAANTRAMGFLNGSNGDATQLVINSGGELQNSLVDQVNLSLKNKFTFASAAHKPVLKLNVATGRVTGSITEPGGKKRSIQAVLTLNNGTPTIRGYTTGSTRTLAFLVTP